MSSRKKKRYTKETNPNKPLPPIPKKYTPSHLLPPGRTRASFDRERKASLNRLENEGLNRQTQKEHDKLTRKAVQRRKFEIDQAVDFSNLPEDLQNPDLYTPSSGFNLEQDAIAQWQRKKVLDKYLGDGDGHTEFEKMDKRNQENVKARLEQAKRIQFESETGIPMIDPKDMSENEFGVEIWKKQQFNKEKKNAEEYFQALRQRSLRNAEIERLESVARHKRAVENPDNIKEIQDEISRQKREQFTKYMVEKQKQDKSQDEFMKRFHRKQRIRQYILEGQYNEDDEEGYDDEENDYDPQLKDMIKKDDDRYDQYLTDRTNLSLEGRDLDKELGTGKPGLIKRGDDDKKKTELLSYPKMKQLVEEKKPISSTEIRDVFQRTYDNIEKTRLKAVHSAQERETRLNKLRKELGVLPLDDNAKGELQEEAIKRVQTGLQTRKQKLLEQLNTSHRQELLQLRRKPDGSEDLAPFIDEDTWDDTKEGMLGQDKYRLKLRPRKKQLYAPLIIEPPEGLDLDNLDLTSSSFGHENNSFEHLDHYVDHHGNTKLDEISILRKHLGVKPSQRSEREQQKRRKMLKKYPSAKVYKHLKSGLKAPVPDRLVPHPNTGKMVQRNSLSYMHRVKADILQEYKDKWKEFDGMTEAEAATHIRAKLKSIDDYPMGPKHELQTRQIFGPTLLDRIGDDAATQKYEHVIRNMHASAIVHVVDEYRVLSTHERSTNDPSDFTIARMRPDLAIPAPNFNNHVDPKTKRRGIHLLMHDSKVFLPTPHFQPEVKLTDGHTLKVPETIFTQEFDPLLDKTRNNPSLLAHERPKHENDGGYLLDSDGNDISHLNKSTDPSDTDNLTKFHQTYGETPTRYVNKVYHDVLGNTLLQQSRQFMHNIQDIPYKRPFNSVLTQFGLSPFNNNQEKKVALIAGEEEKEDENNDGKEKKKKEKIVYHYDYSDTNFRNPRQITQLRNKNGDDHDDDYDDDDEKNKFKFLPVHFKESKLLKLASIPLEVFAPETQNTIQTGIMSTLKFLSTGDTVTDFRAENDNLFSADKNQQRHQKNLKKLLQNEKNPFDSSLRPQFQSSTDTITRSGQNNNTIPLHNPLLSNRPQPHYLKINNNHPSSRFFRPTEAPEHIIRAGERLFGSEQELSNSLLSPSAKIDKTFSHYLQTYRTSTATPHQLRSDMIESFQRDAAKRQLERYTNTSAILKKVMGPVNEKLNDIVTKSTNIINNIIIRNPGNLTLPTQPMGDYTKNSIKQIIPRSEGHYYNDDPYSLPNKRDNDSTIGGSKGTAYYSAIAVPPSLQNHLTTSSKGLQKGIFDINNGGGSSHSHGLDVSNDTPILPEPFRRLNPQNIPTRAEHQLLRRLSSELNQVDHDERVKEMEDFQKFREERGQKLLLQEQQQQQQHQQRSSVSRLQSRLDSLLSPAQLEEKNTKSNWLENKIQTAPLQDHMSYYLQSNAPQLHSLFRKTAALLSPTSTNLQAMPKLNFLQQNNNNTGNDRHNLNNRQQQQQQQQNANRRALVTDLPSSLSTTLPNVAQFVKDEQNRKLDRLHGFTTGAGNRAGGRGSGGNINDDGR